ncbi:Small nuclear ribonucleoprotein-associated protein B [Friedmanniomyces endolithicus]|uniref:Sm protein B n=1 Tax=Friedmanniomyces endolithicus TaxID=329885 RepID=A0AAN6J9U4_9PEZI|nr:Small nuclear ribonucleoprotein-associated protein B [Friedmanniomyces endolithicus]KAK0275650.1 Small nuclear ribonucleoprotein-associated protein B [Friedmanniomyces endolithicus]KAK0316169.1 Small nuclear ribonucleoprotein-associated protein B [Friedmanniomyces endolithicus]KAK0992561.1 Small nuclear ribonucleoprotein-associated protein B [Friedmanniomyces endolithicus]KAK1071200.1 Small nuclear ribonucleoprotein-associated protein B [Friedmanniomyces endolithicus]
MAAPNKQGKMQGFINYRMRATMKDGRQLVGQMLAFDKHMNLVLADCEEYRKVKRKTKTNAPPGAGAAQQTVETEEKRMLGLAIVRGAHVVSCSVDGPPPADPTARLGTSAPGGGAPNVMQAGPGISRPAGRGAGIGLQGPAMGVAGAGFPGFPGAPQGFAGRGGPPPGFAPPGFGGGPPPGFAPQGFQPPPNGRGFGGR